MALTRHGDVWTTGEYVIFRFIRMSDSGKTKIFQVTTMDGILLGDITWFSRWRKYSFNPRVGTIYEETCLRDIAEFISSETRRQREERQKSS